MSNLSRVWAVAAVAAFAAACADDAPPTAVDNSPISTAAYIAPGDALATFGTAGVPDVEVFEVCKRWDGTPGVATFDVFDGSTTNTISTNQGTWTTGVSAQGFDDWACRNVYIEGGAGATVRVTEQTIPGYTVAVMADAFGQSALAVGSDYVEGLVAGTPAAAVTAFFTNTEQRGCTLTIGYWKTHSIYGPAGPADPTWNLVGGPDAAFFTSGQSWLEVFNTSVGGNQYYNLAHQYMGAKLNVLNGAGVPSAVATAITDAEALFNSYDPDDIAGLRGNDSTRRQFVSLAGILEDYNSGDIGPGHCDG